MKKILLFLILSILATFCTPDKYQLRLEKFKNAENHYYKALNLKQNNQLNEALAEVNQALQLDNEHMMAYNLRGDVLVALKKYPEAIENYNQAIFLKPYYTQFYFRKANVYIKMNDYKNADLTFSIVIKNSKSKDHDTASAAFLYFDNNVPEKTKEYLDEALKINGQLYYTWTVYGRYYQSLKKDKEALQAFDKSIEFGTANNFYPWYQKAEIYRAQGKIKEADECKAKGDLARAKAPKF